MTINLAKSIQQDPLMPWSASIKPEMQAVEECLRSSINSAVPTAFELSQHLLTAGGKRLRPALVILAAKACGEHDAHRATVIASCCEIIHMASLVHDDVIDRTDRRRGRVTANAFWGNKVSVLSGDYLLAKSFVMLCQDGDPRLLHEISQMTIVMSESEVLQAVCEGNIAAWEENYWQIIRGKTARFLQSCCKSGAMVAGASDETIQALGDYGLNLGTAFQITDDLLDLAGDPAETGKPIGTDLSEGKATLPILLALKESDDATRGRLLGLLNSSEMTSADIVDISESVQRSGAVDKARSIARGYADKALLCLAALPQSQARESLESLACLMVSRNR